MPAVNGKILVSDELDTLLLKRDQSVEERKPLPAAEACVIESVFPENERGPVTEAEVIAPVPLPVRRPPRVVLPVPPKFTATVVEPITDPFALANKSEFAMVEMAKLVEVAC